MKYCIILAALFALCAAKCRFKGGYVIDVAIKLTHIDVTGTVVGWNQSGSGKCSEGWTKSDASYSSECSKFVTEPQTFAAAIKYCKSLGARMDSFGDSVRFKRSN